MKYRIKITTFSPCKYLNKIDLKSKGFNLTDTKENATTFKDKDKAIQIVEALNEQSEGIIDVPVFEIETEE